MESGAGSQFLGSPEPVDGASTGNVLLALHESTNKILQKLEIHYDALHKDFAEKMASMKASVVQEVISVVSTHTRLQVGTSRSRNSDERKRKTPPPPEKIPFFNLLVEKDKTQFVVQWTIVCTIYSFARSHTSLLTWIPRAAQDQLEGYSGLFDEASGLSVLFFAVGPDQSWSRYHGKVGKLWSFVLRSSIASTILHLRGTEFDTSRTPTSRTVRRTVPSWLSSFGGKKQTAETVSEIVQCLETTDEMTRRAGNADLARRRKRMRVQNEPPADDFECERDFAVSEVRSGMLQKWTYGRSEARKVLLSSVMFLVDKIRGFSTLSAAREDGYEIIFKEASSSFENYVPVEISGTAWEIPLAYVREESDEEHTDNNNELVKDLASSFPSLHLTLRYKRSIVCMDPTVDVTNVPAFLHAEENLSLHQLAVTVLTASLGGKSIKALLKTSRLSLRAVHVLAIGLRGLVRQSLGIELSAMEKCAAAGVTCDDISKDDGDRVTTKGSRLSRGSAQTARNAKFSMSLACFRAEEEKQRASRREQERSVRSEAGGFHAAEDSDSDLGQPWLEGATIS